MMDSSEVLSDFLVMHDVWNYIIDFMGNTPKNCNFVSLMTTSKILNSIVLNNDIFLLHRLGVHLRSCLPHEDAELPPMRLFTFPEGKALCRKLLKGLHIHNMEYLRRSAHPNTIAVVREILKYCVWHTSTARSLQFHEIADICDACETMVNALLKQHTCDTEISNALKLLPHYLDYCDTAIASGSSVTSLFRRFLENSSLFQRNKYVAIATVRAYPDIAEKIDPSVASDPDVILELAQSIYTAKNDAYFTHSANNDEGQQVLLNLLAKESVNDNKALALNLVRYVPACLPELSARLRQDRDVVVEAIKHSPKAVLHAHSSTWEDQEILIRSVAKVPDFLDKLPSKFLEDKKLVLLGLKLDASIFHKLPENLRADYDVALAAVSKPGCNLQYVSDELKANKEVVLAAISNSNSLHHADPILLKDPSFILDVIERRCSCLAEIPDWDESIKTLEFTLKAIALNPSVLQYMKHLDSRDAEMVKKMILVDWRTFIHSRNFHDHSEVALFAIKQNAQAFRYVGSSLRSNQEFRNAACSINPEVQRLLSRKCKTKIKRNRNG